MRWYRHLLRGSLAEKQLDAELRFHLDQQIADYIAAGMTLEEARRRARLKFGGLDQVKEQCRDVGAARFIETLIQDVRYGLRQLRRNPGFTAVAVIALALGIGANTAIFSLIDAVMLKNLPVQNPHQLVLFSSTTDEGMVTGDGPTGKWDYFSTPLFEYIGDHNQVFQSVGAFGRRPDTLMVRVERSGSNGFLERAKGRLVSGNYFSVLGVSAIRGRTLTPQDDLPAARPAAVISYDYWKRRFNRNPSILGQTVDLNGTPFTIVGVAPPEFFGVMLVSSPEDFWLPLSTQPEVMQSTSYLEGNNTFWLNVVARLKPGVSMAQAQSEANGRLRQYLMAQRGSHIPSGNLYEIQHDYIQLSPGGTGISALRENFSEPLHILMVVVLLVLLIACANVANMLLSRAAARHKEISMRLALGAARSRVIRQLLTESLLLAVLGGALGMLVASWGVSILISLEKSSTPIDAQPDSLVLGFTIIVSLVTVALFGLAPALRASKVELVAALKAGGSDGSTVQPGRLGLSKGLVVLQIALSLPLLIGAGLFLRSLNKLEDAESRALNSSQKHVLLVQIDPRLAGYKPSRLSGFYHDLLDRMDALPGVSSASLAGYSPMSGTSMSGNISVEGYTPRHGQSMDAGDLLVAPQYFKTEGMRLLLGRPIGDQDTATSQTVAVVNESFARYFLPNQNPIGKRFSEGFPFKMPGIEIIGVAEDTRFSLNLRKKASRIIFLPVSQMQGGSAFLSPYLNDLGVCRR